MTHAKNFRTGWNKIVCPNPGRLKHYWTQSYHFETRESCVCVDDSVVGSWRWQNVGKRRGKRHADHQSERVNTDTRTLHRLGLLLLLAAPPLDTRPCISRFALGPGFVCRTTSAMLTQRSCCLLQRLSAAGPSLGSELAGTLLCGL